MSSNVRSSLKTAIPPYQILPALRPGAIQSTSPANQSILRFTADRRDIAGIVQGIGEGFEPGGDFALVNIDDAQAFQAAPQLAGVLRGDDDAVRHDADFDRHSVEKPGSLQPLALKGNIALADPRMQLAAGGAGFRGVCSGVDRGGIGRFSVQTAGAGFASHLGKTIIRR